MNETLPLSPPSADGLVTAPVVLPPPAAAPPAPIELPAKLVQTLLQFASQTPQGRALLDGFLLAKGYDELPCQILARPAVLLPMPPQAAQPGTGGV